MFGTKIDFASRYATPRYTPDDSPYDFLARKEIEIQQFPDIGDDEILLGYSPDDEDEPVTIPFDVKKRITIIIQGDNSSGKSVLARNIVIDQLHARFGRKVLFLDPKGDSHNLKNRNINRSHINTLKNHGIMPRSYHAKYITPEGLNVPGAWGERYRLGLSGYKRIQDKEIKINMIWSAFSTLQGEASARALQSFFLADYTPSTMEQLRQMAEEVKPKVLVLESMIDLYQKTGVMGDIGCDYPKLLNEHGILAVELTVSDPEKDTLQDVFLEDAVQHCVQDRKLAVTSGDKQGNLHEPFSVIMDESDVFCGKQKRTAGLVEALTTKFREFSPQMKASGISTYGCDSILITQHAYKLSKTPVTESDWVMFSKISDVDDFEHRIKDRGYDGVDLYDFQNMPYDKETYPKLFCAVDKNKTKKFFFPLPSRTLT